jgi:hypothetical protein
MTNIVLAEITDLQAETINGGFKGNLQNLYFDTINNLQINGRDGVQNNYFINFGNKRHKK